MALQPTDKATLKKAKWQAETALVLAIVGFFTLVPALAAVPFLVLARRKHKRYPKHARKWGKGMVTAADWVLVLPLTIITFAVIAIVIGAVV